MIKSTGKLLSVLVLAGMTANAGSISFDFRFDSDSSSYNNAAKAAAPTTAVSATNLLMKTGRVDFKGKANEELSYRLRWRFDKDYGTSTSMVSNNKTDAFTNHVDLAFIAHKWTPELTLSLGKVASELGGNEGNTAAPDIYLQSQFYRKIAANFIYVSGGKLTYVMDNHEVSLLLLNQSETTTTEQSKMAYGLTYKGLFMENKELSVLASYANDEKQSLTLPDSKKMTGISSLAFKYDPKPYFVSLDYSTFAQKNQSAVDAKDTWNSIVGEFGYNLDGIMPKLKYEMSQYKAETTTSTTTKYDGVSLGVEYKPMAQENFRYHMMVTQLTTKPEVGDSLFEQHFIVGTRINADFLK